MTTNVEGTGSLFLSDYAAQVADTDVLDVSDLRPILHGLYGEVGGIMSTVKKHVREGAAFPGFRRAAEEEFGDTLWYLAALCRRLNISLDEVFTKAASGENYSTASAACDIAKGAVAHVAIPLSSAALDDTLFALGRSAAALLGPPPAREVIDAFARHYLDALHAANLRFADVARGNVQKARGAFLPPPPEVLIDFDRDFGIEEQLPRIFRIRINQRRSGKSYLQMNGVFVGDPLTDNSNDPDGYRFHDVFHFAYAAILHWSPVMRALIKHKRKSNSRYDEVEDGGRANVVEEGLTAWIFSKAKDLRFFEDQRRLSLGMLKTISDFVSGYEVARCPLKLWERAILDGYAVFRQVRGAKGGWVVGNRDDRTIGYEPLKD